MLRSTCDLRVGGRFLPTCYRASHTASGAPSSLPSAPRAEIFRGVRSSLTKTGSRTAPRERCGSTRPKTPSLCGSRPLARSRARELCNRCPRSGSVLRHPFHRFNHDTRSLPAFAAVRFSCLRDLSFLLSNDLSSRAAVRPHHGWMRGPLNEGQEKPFAVAGSSAIDVPLLRKLLLRMRARRPESPRVEVLPSNGEEEGNEEPRLTDSRAPSVTQFH